MRADSFIFIYSYVVVNLYLCNWYKVRLTITERDSSRFVFERTISLYYIEADFSADQCVQLPHTHDDIVAVVRGGAGCEGTRSLFIIFALFTVEKTTLAPNSSYVCARSADVATERN